jgi:hypothetical protein
MAMGQDQGGGLFARPDVPALGPATWAEMSAVHPDSPLVGGRAPYSGGIEPAFNLRRVALAAPNPSPHPGAEGIQGHPSELLNFKGSPMPWILLAALAYLGLVHLHAAGRFGATRVSASSGK